ncbi:MAG: type II toxin-antitoxin system VapC family toxin [Chloroflexi bacterium]|nr:type II toxin-antitoxin system VapC family toxin [Chloroflexota bacterium]
MSQPPPRDRVVVDTDVVSFLLKRDSRAELYRPHLTDRMLVISFMTVAELDRWVLARNWGERRRTALEQHLRNFVVYPFDRALCRVWAEVTVGVSRRGRQIGWADAWIAATALLHGIPLITHNAKDYRGVDRLVVVSETT